jgi:hypothetical protein
MTSQPKTLRSASIRTWWISVALASCANIGPLQPQDYDHLYWAAKWARWERSCYQSNSIAWFDELYGRRFSALRHSYQTAFPEILFPELPSELVDGTVVWSCRTGRHTDKAEAFARILREQEAIIGSN